MNTALILESRQSITGLHVRMAGEFRSDDATHLHAHLKEQLQHGQRLFVDVRDLKEIPPVSRLAFWQSLEPLPLSVNNIFFKGEQGFTLARNGCRVLICKKKKCSCKDKCTVCACKQRAKKAKLL